ncbi:MAG: hypothetical protein K2L88_03395, partial [Clostridiales bacterium]|nr:hypothetical protein [Clostridiales bacterium]
GDKVMDITPVCKIAFSISICIIAAALIFSIVWKKRSAKGDAARKHAVFTPFNIFLIGFFFAATVMAYPVFRYGDFADEGGFVGFFKSAMISILNSLQMFFLNAGFSEVKGVINSSAVQANMASAYTIYFAVLYVVAPFLTFGIILSFFKDFVARLKYMLCPAADTYVFSEINERSLALAKDIFKNGRKGRKLVVFTGACSDGDDKEKEEMDDLIDEAKKIGAMCLKNDINEIKLKRAGKGHTRKFYFISEDEDRNLKQAIELIGRCKEIKNYNDFGTQFFVFANSVESEVFLDSIDNGNMKVRRITEYGNTMLNTLRKYSIFTNAVQKGKVKEINLLVVGAGSYGKELIKTVCWLGQMPNYEVNIHAFDAGNAEDKFKNLVPEFMAMNGKRIDGEPYYNITFHNNVDVHSGAFCDELAKIGNVTTAFVALGNDELNVETAVKLRTLFGRAKDKSGAIIPPIYAIIFNSVKSDIFKQYGGLKSVTGKDYNIEFIDGIAFHYTLDVIEREELEKEGLKCHLQWSTTEADREAATEKYEKYEYYRKSSIAESVHKAIMKELGIYAVDENGIVSDELAEYEHKRWSAYMRSEGYVYGTEKDDIAKTHYDLKPYKKLSKSEQDKDYIVKS